MYREDFHSLRSHTPLLASVARPELERPAGIESLYESLLLTLEWGDVLITFKTSSSCLIVLPRRGSDEFGSDLE